MLSKILAQTGDDDDDGEEQSENVNVSDLIAEIGEHSDSEFEESKAQMSDSASQGTGEEAKNNSGTPAKKKRPSNVEDISNPIERAEALEKLKANVGNYTMIAPLRSKRKANSNSAMAVHNVVRLNLLAKMVQQLGHARQRDGLPSSCSVSSKFVAVGTTRGVVLLFDFKQNLVAVLGQASDTKARGAVTSVDLSPNNDHLIAGHLSGQLILWDIPGKSVVKTIDVFANPIVSVKCTYSNSYEFVAIDSVGNVNIISLTRILFAYSVDAPCLLNGKAGQILSMSMLPRSPRIAHPTDKFSLLALANEQMVRENIFSTLHNASNFLFIYFLACFNCFHEKRRLLSHCYLSPEYCIEFHAFLRVQEQN